MELICNWKNQNHILFAFETLVHEKNAQLSNWHQICHLTGAHLEKLMSRKPKDKMHIFDHFLSHINL